ncbi:hypothetical protein SDRG_02736 [Saprolegnia diclina VS20]|uniref:SUI1 domain-containing protein n=1 Tax=Saprolegnia diclina (strain VS20) TaxID=1156394 RepID=T0QZF2_SAPDV|nr:hypothetical protein SDRG_02736 [Saprolegnia diclina VS20]EQC40081.1 hypothetical protein SDRG_02736 [Saprolegnia diclina VS20]|eukprot:XP_008606555.1 hypothetical protein SDRG_02736 [Saprolegnia diclina VS20]
MFAKAFNLSGNTRLKGKDVKKLRVDLLRACAIDGDVAWSYLEKAPIARVKLAAPSRTLLYTDADMNVVAFDINGKGDVVPTTFLLWHEPELRNRMPMLTVHAPVSHYLLRGADPMLPGVVRRFETPLEKGQLRAVCISGNPMPFAVGSMVVDDDHLASQGWKGKAMELYHVYGDELSKMGPSHKRFVPDGFSDSIIEPTSEDIAEAAAIEVQGLSDDEAKPAPIDDGSDNEDETTSLSVPEMDALLEHSFYQAMKKIKPSDAPMLGNQFYGNYVLPQRPLGSTIHLKGTSYKKFSVFLKAMAHHGSIELKEQDGVQTITLFRKTHPDVARHTLHHSEQDAIDQAAEEATGGAFVPGQHAPEVLQLYRLTQQTQLVCDNASLKETFATSELRNKLNAYISAHGLVDPREPQFVKLNPDLTDALYKKKPDAGYPVKLPRKDILSLFLDRLRAYHAVILYPGHDAKEIVGDFKPVHIKTELSKRQKPVTIVSNFAQFGIDAETLAHDAQKKWACSASALLAAEKAKELDVHIQGNLATDVVAYLSKVYKLPPKYCVTEFGKGIKAKR